LRGIISAYHRCCTELVERNGGFVAKYKGDGLLAYFGYPQANEPIRARLGAVASQADRACRATEQGDEIPILVDANIHALRLVKSTSSAL
jgi:class 3 adenylate cyclase